jgi:hypothetical protein
MLWFELYFGTNPPLGILEYSVFAGIHVLNEGRCN